MEATTERRRREEGKRFVVDQGTRSYRMPRPSQDA